MLPSRKFTSNKQASTDADAVAGEVGAATRKSRFKRRNTKVTSDTAEASAAKDKSHDKDVGKGKEVVEDTQGDTMLVLRNMKKR